MTDVERFFQGLVIQADKASPEDKERGRRLAEQFKESRLAYKDRKIWQKTYC